MPRLRQASRFAAESYPLSVIAATRELGLAARHRPGRLRENNRAENSHLVIRRRERKRQKFKSQGGAPTLSRRSCVDLQHVQCPTPPGPPQHPPPPSGRGKRRVGCSNHSGLTPICERGPEDQIRLTCQFRQRLCSIRASMPRCSAASPMGRSYSANSKQVTSPFSVYPRQRRPSFYYSRIHL